MYEHWRELCVHVRVCMYVCGGYMRDDTWVYRTA